MTSDVKLLPLPEEEWNVRYGYCADTVTDYARANVLHHTAPLRYALDNAARDIKTLREVRDAHAAEIERLRAEREVIVAEAVKYADKSGRLEAKVDRLAEALLNILPFVEHSDSCGDRDAYNLAEVRTCDCGLDGIREHADALLDHEQEVGNWACEMRPNT